MKSMETGIKSDGADLMLALALSGGVTFVLFLVASVVVFVMARRRYKRAARQFGDALGSAWGGMAPLLYAGTLAVGVVGIGAGFVLMRDAKTARQGYVCVVLGIAHVLVLVVLTCLALMALVHAYGPSVVPGLTSMGLPPSTPMVPSSFRASGGA